MCPKCALLAGLKLSRVYVVQLDDLHETDQRLNYLHYLDYLNCGDRPAVGAFMSKT